MAERGLLFNACGMLRVQPTDQLSDLEKETLGNMEQDGLRQTQFVRGLEADRLRARDFGWEAKMLEFDMPPDDESSPNKSFGAVLDSLAGFIRCSDACNYFYKKAAAQGVVFHFGPDKGAFECLVEEQVGAEGRKKATGLKTKDGITHKFDVVVIAGEYFYSYTHVDSLCTFYSDTFPNPKPDPSRRSYSRSWHTTWSLRPAAWLLSRSTSRTRPSGTSIRPNASPSLRGVVFRGEKARTPGASMSSLGLRKVSSR